jgi:hypothetical protein
MQKRQKSVRNLIAKDLYVNAKFKHKVEKGYKERLQIQEEEELEQEKRDFINGKREIQE